MSAADFNIDRNTTRPIALIARRADYGQRQRQHEQEARRKLRKLRDELAGMPL